MWKRNNSYQDKGSIPFNNSMGKLERLNMWWGVAGRAKIENMIEAYYNTLEVIYGEIYPYLDDKEKKEINDELKEIERFLDQTSDDVASATNKRMGSNKCDILARKLSNLGHKYQLEWFDLKKWNKEQKAAEPVMQG